VLAGWVLAAVVVAAAATGRWGRPAAVPLAALSCLWLLVNSPMEGSVLVEVTDTRGLTAADLAGLAGLLLAALAFARPPRR
jgi:hypothetical protein